MAGLLKELWIDLLIGDVENFFQNDTFLSHGVNMSYAVENDRINFTYKGPRPGITKNFRTNGTTTLPVYMRTDVPEYVTLDNYSTDQMVLPRVDLFALPYDKKQSLLQDMRNALVARIADEGIWDIGPAANQATTPVLAVPTGNADAGDGYDAITRTDIVTLRKALDKQYPGLKDAKWVLMLDVDAYWYLVDNDSLLNAQYANSAPIGALLSRMQGNTGRTGVAGMSREPIPLEVANFTIMCDGRTPWYLHTNSTKIAYGGTVTPGTHFKSAIAYVEQLTFCTGLGTTELFDLPGEPSKQADLASFLTRAYVGPWGTTASNLRHAAALLRRPHS